MGNSCATRRRGLDGPGQYAVQILRALSSATVVGVDLDPAKRERAVELGGDHAIDPALPESPAMLRDELAANAGAAAVLDIVGSDATLAFSAGELGTAAGWSSSASAVGPCPRASCRSHRR